jgi:hypothetical protein
MEFTPPCASAMVCCPTFKVMESVGHKLKINLSLLKLIYPKNFFDGIGVGIPSLTRAR